MVPAEFLNCEVFNACKVEHKTNVWDYSVQSNSSPLWFLMHVKLTHLHHLKKKKKLRHKLYQP